ncbi:MAG: peptide transporter, partial [Planctomycetota bacterium]
AGASLASAGPGQGLLWQQYLVQSDSLRAFGVAENIPWWVTPADPEVLGSRSFFQSPWLVPIGLFALATILQRADNFGMAYIMYRLTSDVEKLPFPMAPVQAQGIVALADASNSRETWRWRVFSFGSMLGIAFGAVYVALPSVSGAFLPEPIEIIEIPFVDLTTNYEEIVPTVPIIISFNLGFLLAGMVLPFWAMVGSFVGLCVTLLLNPFVLRPAGILDGWSPGTGAIQTIQSNTLDFYFSFGLGLTFAIAVIGIWHVASSFRKSRQTGDAPRVDIKALFNPPKGRGDFSLWIAVAVYFVTMTATIGVAWLLLRESHASNPDTVSPVTWTLLGIFVFYGFVYTPIISYVAARMEGIVGMTVQIPFIREATFILTGYQGTAVWFTPFPYH